MLGLPQSPFTYSLLVAAAGREGKLEIAERVYREACAAGKADCFVCNAIMDANIRQRRWQACPALPDIAHHYS